LPRYHCVRKCWILHYSTAFTIAAMLTIFDDRYRLSHKFCLLQNLDVLIIFRFKKLTATFRAAIKVELPNFIRFDFLATESLVPSLTTLLSFARLALL